MLNLEQFVLTKIAEEATEVGKRALKQQQFGADQHDGGFLPNKRRLTEEATDLMMWLAWGRWLNIVGVPDVSNSHRYLQKRGKIIDVLRISVAQGQVEPAVLQFFVDNHHL